MADLQEVKARIAKYLQDCMDSESYEDADAASQALDIIDLAEKDNLVLED